MTDASGREAIPQIAAIISQIDICLFATRGDAGQIHARPMSNNGQVEWDGRSWFFAPSAGRLVAELRSDPSAVAAYRAEEGYTFVSVSGRATIESDAELKKHNLGPRALALVGFSQGAMLALGVGLKRSPSPSAIVGYSGPLATVEALPQRPGSAPAILLVHGDMDEVIPVDAMYIAREQLARAGLPVEWHVAEGIGHGIDAQGLHLGGAFLKQAFAATAQLAPGS